jgi:SAM-dependent methyltransferase
MSVFYRNSGGVPLASTLSYIARKKMFDAFVDNFRPDRSTTVLDVGVTSDSSFRESNYFEQLYPYPQNITCVGTEDGSHLAEKYAGLRFQKVRAGEPLPFRDAEFDIAFSNAVVEHVGNREQQGRFMRELYRVAKGFFVTTPNRWFPVEHHTGLPLLHYLPGPLFRSVIRGSRYDYWASEEHLNIFTGRELSKILPRSASARVEKIRLFGVASNLVAIGRRQ